MQSHRPYDFWELIQDGFIITIALYVATLPLPHLTEKQTQAQTRTPVQVTRIDSTSDQPATEASDRFAQPLPHPIDSSCGTFVKPMQVFQDQFKC